MSTSAKATRIVTALAGAGIAAATTMLAATPAHASTAGGEITRSEALQRAQTWVDERVPYSQTTYWTDQNGTYREDCSGYVSMAWHLTSSLVTQTLPSVSYKLGDFSQLKPADILDYTDHHTILFSAWTNRSNGDFEYFAES